MAVVRLLTVHLTGPSCQEVLESPETVLDPVAPLPCSNEPWRADVSLKTYHIELLLPGCTDHDERHRAIGRTGSAQPHILDPRLPRVLMPAPLLTRDQVVTFDLASIGQGKAIGR